jgi:outer membrane protein assembly factor BamA
MRGCYLFFFLCLVSGALQAATDSTRVRSRSKVPLQDTTQRLTINRLLIIGNKVTRDFIIERELSYQAGDTVGSQTLLESFEKDKIKLLNTRLFNSITMKLLDYENGTADVLVDVSERWYTFPVPILEIADRNFNEWWQNYNHDLRRLNYGLKLYQYNCRGRNETLLLTAKFGFTNIFRLSYRIPYLDRKRKQGVAFDAFYDERENIAYQTNDNKLVFIRSNENFRTTRGGSVSYTYRNSFYHFHGITLETNNVTVSDSLLKLNAEYLGKPLTRTQSFSSVMYNYAYENRDFVTYPLKGSYITATFRHQGIFKGDDLRKTEVAGQFSLYRDVGKGFFISNSSNAYVSFQNVPYANYSALGYNRQFVRGYEVYLIEGPQFVYNKFTFKKLVLNRIFDLGGPLEQFQKVPVAIYAKVYADAGYVWQYAGYQFATQLTDRLLTGVGFGFDLVTSHDATIRLEYSFNREGEQGVFFHVKKEF